MSQIGNPQAAPGNPDHPVDDYLDALLGIPTAVSAPPQPAVEIAPAQVLTQATPEAVPAEDPVIDVATAEEPAVEAFVAEEPALEVLAVDAVAEIQIKVDAEVEVDAPPAVAVHSASDTPTATVDAPGNAPAAYAPPLAAAPSIRAAHAPIGQRWLRVAVGEDRYAVELLRVQEVVRLAPIIAVRGAPASLLGVMNLRGRVVPVHDLGRWLRRNPVETEDRSRIVVLEHHDELTGLLVTAVTDVVTLDATQIEPPTAALRNRTSMGIARTAGAPPTVLLDASAIFD